MSETYRITVRLSLDEKGQLESLAERLNLDKSATIRHAIQQASNARQVLPQAGIFTSIRTQFRVPIRIRRRS